MILRFQTLLFTFLLIACEPMEPEMAALSPSNLSFEVMIDESISNRVTVEATADDVNYYMFSFGDGSEKLRENSGTVTYSYEEAGTYTIEVYAHTTADVFISETKNVEITVEQTSDFEDEGFVSPTEYAGYELVWQDEFEANELSNDYTFETGTGSNGWGNNESQYYREQNTRLEQGYLIIQAKEENFGGSDYTSSRIITEGKREFKYGRFDIRAKMPYGQGIWPAIWMLGANFREVGWPNCGEIDIMEMIGGQGRESTVHGTVHWQSNEGYANYGHSKTLQGETLAEQFHVFSIIWDDNSIEWLIDNQSYGSIDTTPSHLDEFREEFFFIFNVAVGGNWPQYPDETTEFPQEMWIDYIRVFQQP
ncbi:family 16 glycosylhydrolase [Marivirga sp.]|uniref:family 16 glycosylhydrolase n=1 Tax=Marivirga sp. TaxID=2018662 RepID=UPI002D7FD04D|nr:family 16 glycosylhydrolase [Marivirga sp.]HET8859195.1 family 16 glycosylhydrolase [Marivirga sp.]